MFYESDSKGDTEENSEDENLQSMDVDEEHTDQVDVIAIGGSNCKTLQKKLIGDDFVMILDITVIS